MQKVSSRSSLERIYRALIFPHFDLCAPVWDDYAAELKVNYSDYKARVITGDDYRSSPTETLSKLGWDTLQCRRDSKLFSLVDKNIKEGQI